jgi:hypothetical protein
MLAVVLDDETRISRKDARAAVRDMRRLGARPLLRDAVAAGEISRSWADAITEWTKDLPAAMWDDTDKILLEAAAGGADQDDLRTITWLALEKWRQQRPDDGEDDRFEDRYVRSLGCHRVPVRLMPASVGGVG